MKLNKSLILAGTALVSLASATTVFAQSTATQEAEKTTEVIVRGTRAGAGPINKETGPKQKSVISQDYISLQSPGQTIAETLNIVPGVNFTSNDPYGSSGGDIFIRGLDNSRISLTFDGVQLNDAGNYAIYTNQQLDPELIENASVITGATDVDSMTASATGGTVNYTTRKTRDTFGGQVSASIGSFDYRRTFALVDTGSFGPFGTQAWFAVSSTKADTFTDDKLIGDSGELRKTQYNFSVYQPVGDNGNYMSLSGHYNENRNHFIFGQSLANFAANGPFYNSINRGNINPSNTGNLRFKSKWNLSDNLTFTADASYQYVLANGGGNSSVNEVTGKVGNFWYSKLVGVDVNGDGDALDTSVTIYRPNTTHTDRYGAQLGLIWRLNDDHTIRGGLSIDRGRTRQTGEATLTQANGAPLNVFGAKEDESLRIKTNNGSTWQRRNRFSKANVNVWSLEYRGRFLENRMMVVAGVRSQSMERDLNQYCYSRTTGTGSFDPFCTDQTPTTTNADGTVTFASNAGMSFIKPFQRIVKFDVVAPSLGLTYRIGDNGMAFFNYSENMSSPRTDNYYAVVMRNGQLDVANPDPEKTKNYEVGYRYNSSKLTASGSVWKKSYKNRIVSSYDSDTDTFFDRNVGEVEMKGAEASLAFRPMDNLAVITGATYTDTEVQNDIPNGEVTVVKGTDQIGDILYIPTKGKKLVEVPDVMFNLGFIYDVNDDTQLSLIGKHVGKRFVTDVNDIEAPAYTTWNFTARRDLNIFKSGAYLQLNVINLFDEYYYGNLSTSTAGTTINTPSGTRIVGGSLPNNPQYNVGAPRTVSVTLNIAF